MKPGSILLIQSKGFLPDQIRLHMRIWAKLTGTKPSLYNHAETIIRYRGNMVSMGARAGGAEITALEDYLSQHPNYTVLEPVIDLNDREIFQLETYCEDVCFRNKRPYQKAMFLAWIAKLKSFGLFNWGDQSDKKLYCYELSARCASLVNRWDGEVGLVSVYQILENRHYQITEKHFNK